MKTFKKFVSAALCVQLVASQMAFAAPVSRTPQQKKVSQEEIAKRVTSFSKNYPVNPILFSGWVVAACAIGVLVKNAIKKNMVEPQDAIKESVEKLENGIADKSVAPYKISESIRTVNDFAKKYAVQKNEYFYRFYKFLPAHDTYEAPFWERAYTKNGGKIPAELQGFRSATTKLQEEMEVASYSMPIKTKETINVLVTRINENFYALKSASNEKSAAKFSAELERDMQALSKIKVENIPMKSAIRNLLDKTVESLRGKGGALGFAGVLVAGTALMFVASSSANAAVVTNPRLTVQRDLASAYKNAPDAFLAYVLSENKAYGTELVSSVIYENQSSYYPLLSRQMDIALNPKVIGCISKLMKVRNPQQAKSALVRQLEAESYR